MKTSKKNVTPRQFVDQISFGATFSFAFLMTTLVASSVVQASDLQIYATPTAGKKTIVMMLDTSGSMSPNNNDYRENRLAALKTGMNAFLDSNNPNLNEVRVGLGHFSVGGNGRAGRILVAVDKLGPVGSDQRNALRTAVQNLSATGGTPTAHAYAEAAAYLMGTTTRSIASIQKDVYRKQDVNYYSCNSNYPQFNSSDLRCYKYKNQDWWGNITYSGGSVQATFLRTETQYYQCGGYYNTDFDSGTQSCSSWVSISQPSDSELAQDGSKGTSLGTIYFKYEDQLNGSNADSGFVNSIDSIKNTTKTAYISPLPAEKDRVSCDGQGIYILSDGAANGTSTSRATNVMTAALDTKGTDFNCSGGMTDANDPDGNAGGWNCMGEFAKRLFDKTKNPAGVSIQTAFVGFGSDMNSLSQRFVQRACQLSSRSQADRSGDDACSPGQNATYSIASPGYGNGGFFTTQSAQGVTNSVIAFINNLGAAPLEPLTTGAISVPVDNLNPSGLQPYGYLRGLEPNPQGDDLIWAGNLKKYKVILSGTNAGAFAAANGSTLVYNSEGGFNTGTKDIWNSSAVYNGQSYNDGGIIRLGGAYSKVPMPITGQTENLAIKPPQYAYAAKENSLRNLVTDVKSTDAANLTNAANGSSFIKVPGGSIPTTSVSTYVLNQFKTQDVLKDFPLLAKIKLLNYLGYSVPYDETATALPTTLSLSAAPFLAMGGSIHSFPVQLTYSGTLDDKGELTDTRSQSVLYGTMDGGLHIVDSNTGVEQMVFVPAELLRNTNASKALIKGQTDSNSPVSGVDGAWVSDSVYKAQRASSQSESSVVKALKMNIYGGLRMGGNSYYGIDVLNPSSPKLLFRVGSDVSGYERMGQSWSKPVLANIRYNGKIRRVMIVGGGYDQCYENPNFKLSTSNVSNTDYPDTTCNNKAEAQGNAVYIIDADTGERIWWTSSSTGATVQNANMKNSIVSRISALDRDADGLIDHLYFADLGGQVFRADLNNNQTKSGSSYSAFGVRVTRLANLATNDTTNNAGNDYTGSKAPRFYEAPTLTIHDVGASTFILVGLASGNRSTPLDVYPATSGRDGMLPSTALNDRPVNNVYGIIDRDFIKNNLITGSPTLETSNLTLSSLQKNPQLLSGQIANAFIGSSATKQGWYRSLSSNSAGTERGGTSFRVKGGMKAYEEPLALTGNLIVPVYDPQGTGVAPQNPCLPRVVGETDRQLYGLPFGVYLKSDGTADRGTGGKENSSGFVTKTVCPAGVTECNDNVIGTGIRGLAIVPTNINSTDACAGKTIAGNQNGVGKWSCEQVINPTRWYEKWIK
ncbi:VWA domain-containing protein [Acinetobacter ursingii]|uniref:VWA domain-containing protein n=1 Tax=Acinetobacter ursingii TaxID=108980 RepID=UPI00370A0EB1